MDLYGGLFELVLACCNRAGVRGAPSYTLGMLALGALVCLSLLSAMTLLWGIGVIQNPYSQRAFLGLLYCAFLANLVLARLKFRADLRAGLS